MKAAVERYVAKKGMLPGMAYLLQPDWISLLKLRLGNRKAQKVSLTPAKPAEGRIRAVFAFY